MVFVALGAAAFAYTVTRQSYVPLVLMLSVPFFSAVHDAQWSPVLCAAMLSPAFGWDTTYKPSIGLAVLAGARRKVPTAAVAEALVVVWLAVSPQWPADWYAVVRGQSHF